MKIRTTTSHPTSYGLDGKVTVITGATSGLGAGFASAFADAGSKVALGGRRLERLNALQIELEKSGAKAFSMQMDVTDPKQCLSLADQTFDHFGRLDILINCAGVGTAIPALHESVEHFRSVVDTNLMGSYWMAQACARHMGSGSSIINISSVIGLTSVGLPQAAYASSKSAIIGLTRDLAQQWAGRKGIRVNAVAPGYFLTEMTAEMDRLTMDEIIERRVPLGRLGRIEECAAAVLFLASDAASFINGVCLPVDGGLLTM